MNSEQISLPTHVFYRFFCNETTLLFPCDFEEMFEYMENLAANNNENLKNVNYRSCIDIIIFVT